MSSASASLPSIQIHSNFEKKKKKKKKKGAKKEGGKERKGKERKGKARQGLDQETMMHTTTACFIAASGVLTASLFARRRRRSARRVAHPEAFAKHVESIYAAEGKASNPMDFDESTMCNYRQGNFDLVRKDIDRAFDVASRKVFYRVCRELCIPDAFIMRSELISFKKVCLCIFRMGEKTRKDLQQLLSFFFQDDDFDARRMEEHGGQDWIVAATHRR